MPPPRRRHRVEPDPRPVYPIGSFFNAARLLVWPAEAPATDELKPKRDISDQACLVVLETGRETPVSPDHDGDRCPAETARLWSTRAASCPSVSTPRIAESFHMFLLSLYDSLAAAANPPEGT